MPQRGTRWSAAVLAVMFATQSLVAAGAPAAAEVARSASGVCDDREQIRQGLCGNICRCGAYVQILDAVAAAAKGGW